MTRREVAIVGLLEFRVEHDEERHNWRGNRLAVHQVVGQAHEVVARDRRIHHVALEGAGRLTTDGRFHEPGEQDRGAQGSHRDAVAGVQPVSGGEHDAEDEQ